jgi:hypothetical protein
MEVGTRVRYIRIDNEEYKESGFYPSVGTLGTVKKIHKFDILVKCDSGTKGDGTWWTEPESVEKV